MNRKAITILVLAFASAASARDNQTATLTPIQPGGAPFTLSIEQVEWTGDPLPAIHSAATAVFGDKWVFIGGRTAGLHGFACNAMQNFAPAEFSDEIIVIDLANETLHSRSIGGTASGLDATEQAAMTATNPLFVQDGERLLVAGGYGYDGSSAGSHFTTFATLRIIDVPGIVGWVMGDRTSLSDHVRFVGPPADAPGSLATDFFTLTGGDLFRVERPKGVEYWLCLGQSFMQGYSCGPNFPNQTYAQQVRRFAIDLDAAEPAAHFLGATPTESWARRRDLNMFPARVPGGLGAVVGGGPFTTSLPAGIWTVPIVVTADGSMSMDDPADPETFKQGFNIYHAAQLPMWSASRGENWFAVLGGIGYQVVTNGHLNTAANLPYSNAASAIRYAPATDEWSEHLLLASYPEVLSSSSGNPLYFGTETAVFPLVDPDSHGMFDLDALLATGSPVEVALVFGGIACDGQGLLPLPTTYGSNLMFRVTLSAACPGDLNDDGLVDGADITLLLASWGDVPPNAIVPADLNGDGEVNGADLSILLANWGPCGKR